jgi:hypothetical protein
MLVCDGKTIAEMTANHPNGLGASDAADRFQPGARVDFGL